MRSMDSRDDAINGPALWRLAGVFFWLEDALRFRDMEEAIGLRYTIQAQGGASNKCTDFGRSYWR
jgi:hypothetical protein